MPSFVWRREFDEAYKNPYEYEAQEQFVREAKVILCEIQKALQRFDFHFTSSDVSVSKAAWMIHNDAFDALIEALTLLEQRKHRLVGRIFRDVWEAAQLAEYFISGTSQAERDLKKWFNNEIISHKFIREALERIGKQKEKENVRRQHIEFSQWTHRSYRALLKSYSLGDSERLVYDGYENDSVLPHTISLYYAILGMLILQNVDSIGLSQIISKTEIRRIMKEGMEKKTTQRRFAPVG